MRGESVSSSVSGGVPGGVAAVVFDWAGTVVDFGSLAPMNTFRQLFEANGVPISVDEARAPMGLPKRDHIAAIGRGSRVAQAWRDANRGCEFTPSDVDALYEQYVPMNRAAVLRHAQLVPGVAPLLEHLRGRDIRIGSTTGYAREVLAPLVKVAARQGFAPDNIVCADDVDLGRPAPLAMYRTFLDLRVWPAWCVVKVDDTAPGLGEGSSAGCWTVAVTDSGNEVGLSQDAWEALPALEQRRLRARAADRLSGAAPDYVIDSVAGLPPVIADIDRRLAAGERPGRSSRSAIGAQAA
jgi:phosphonoacetaldehyde hydrolase